VVTTTLGNDGIGATPGQHLLVADSSADFAAVITRLLRDPAERDRLGESARKFAAERFAPAVSAAALEREHQALVGAPALTRRSAG
jgi:glycosyltransferase involved in cell wall biosynthesis